MQEQTYLSMENYLRRYEARKSEAALPPHERMLERLFAPYTDPRNPEELLSALKKGFTEDEAAVWCLYPEFTVDAVGKAPEDVAPDLPEHLRAQAAALSASLAEKAFLYPTPTRDGRDGYVCTYLLDVISAHITVNDGTGLDTALQHYWGDLMAGDSAHLRRNITEHRILPHEGALTGEEGHGRIPMHLDIPDTRAVLPFDRLTEMLDRCRSFAVFSCLCRSIEEHNGTRQCDLPIKDVCIVFDQAADSAIASGAGRAVTREEILQIVRRCRDLGMVQIISNAEHPLALCNCCKCCCLCLRSLQHYEDVMCVPTRFVADASRRESCIRCGKCVKICPLGAVSLPEIGVQVQAQKCAGCGECVSLCPRGVLKLTARSGASAALPQERLDRIYL